MIDRTNWDFGQKKNNFLCLSIQVYGVAIPLFIKELNKKGSSSQSERKKQIEQLLEIVPVEKIKDITADREFPSYKLLDYLMNKNIPFTWRSKSNLLFLGKKLKDYQEGVHYKKVSNKQTIFLVVKKKAGVMKEDWYIITNHKPKKATFRYRRRWKIEELFQFLKKRGFQLEETHLKDSERLETLFRMLVLTAVLILKLFFSEQKRIQLKQKFKKKNHTYPQHSIFRAALDFALSAFNSLLIRPLKLLNSS